MIIIASKPGQLSNRLFLFAHFVANAIEHHRVVRNPSFDDYAHRFPATCGHIVSRYPSRKAPHSKPRWMRRAAYWFVNRGSAVLARLGLGNNRLVTIVRIDWNEVRELDEPPMEAILDRARVTVAQGWLFLDEPNLEKHKDAVRDFFSPDDATRCVVDELVGELHRRYDVVIGLHMRRGDYDRFLGGKYLFPPTAYRRIAEAAKALFPERSVCFLVCSDEDIPDIVRAAGDVYAGPADAVTDLYCLASCDYLIGPPSTYSMWASYYGDVPLLVLEHPDDAVRLDRFSVVRSQGDFPEVRVLRADPAADPAPFGSQKR